MSDLGLVEGTDFTYLPVGDGGTAAIAFLRDEVNSYAGAVSDAAILASRGIELREITPEAYLGFFGNGIAMLESQMAATPDLAPKFGRALVRGMRFASDPANKERSLAYGYQPPEHWQAIHDSAVASGALSEALPDLSAVYSNEFVPGWNA